MGFWDFLPFVGDNKPAPAPPKPTDLEREKTPAPKSKSAPAATGTLDLGGGFGIAPGAPTIAPAPTPTPTPTPTAAPARDLSGIWDSIPMSAPRPTATPTPTPAAFPGLGGGFGIAPGAPALVPPITPTPTPTPLSPANALPAAHPGSTTFDNVKNQGQNPGPVTPLQPTQREQYEVDFLKSLGWTAPGEYNTVSPQKRSEQYSSNSLTPLAAYSYQVDAAERDRITEKYRNMDGFIPPTSTQGMPTPAETPFEADVSTAELTWEAYDALSEPQKRAVDLNGLLVAARNLDLSKDWKLEGDELNEYNSRATAIFGKPDTSEKIAPNVVHLLADVNWSAVGQDLDEFLSLERGFTISELADLDTRGIEFERLEEKRITTQPNASGYGPREATTSLRTNFNEVRSEENVAAADAFLAQKAGERFDAVMSDPALRLWSLPASLQLAQTGTTIRPTGAGVPYGYGIQTDRTTDQGKAKEAFYQSAYNYLADTTNMDLQPLWDEMTAMGFNDADTNEFWRFVDDRTRQERRWGQVGSPFGEPGRSYRDPDSIRKLVGLEG